MTKLYRTILTILAFVGLFLLMMTINLSILESVCKDPDGGIIRLPSHNVLACVIFPGDLANESMGIPTR